MCLCVENDSKIFYIILVKGLTLSDWIVLPTLDSLTTFPLSDE